MVRSQWWEATLDLAVMPILPRQTLLLLAMLISVAGCGDRAKLLVTAGIGPAPALPPPRQTLIPTIKVAKATGWASGAGPTAAPGLVVQPFAVGLAHPRWLYLLPNGDVLVAESAAPRRPDDGKGLKGWFMKMFMKKAGSAVPSADSITLLRDVDGDGMAETRSALPMGRFVGGQDRRQDFLLPASLDDYVAEDNPVRAVEAFIDELDLVAIGFAGATPAHTGRPACQADRAGGGQHRAVSRGLRPCRSGSQRRAPGTGGSTP